MLKKVKIFFILPVFLLLLLLNYSVYASALRLPQLVSDGMVLQREVSLKIWGWAAVGEKVQIKFNQKKYSTLAGSNGQWMVLIDPMKPGGPYEMSITADTTIIIHNILIGDVWFCSGQSNMVINMERVKEIYHKEIAAAHYPEIRNFFVSTSADLGKVHDDLPNGRWVAADPKTILDFGAVSYFFAKKLYQKYHVPIGIINSSVGGTPVQAWMSKEGIGNFSSYANRLQRLEDTGFRNNLIRLATVERQRQDKILQTPDLGLTGLIPWYDTSYISNNWKPFWLPGYWADQGISGLNGMVWFRKQVNISADMAAQEVHLMMGRIVDADFIYVNGVLRGSTPYQYPPRRYVLPPGALKPGKNVIVIRIINTGGKGGFVPGKQYYLAAGRDTIDLRGDWQYKVGAVFEPADQTHTSNDFSAQNEPAALYNAMVAPATNFAIKGFVWYQGESNTGNPKEYKALLAGLINDWRQKWRQGTLPFVYAQLPNFMEAKYAPSESQWAELRQSQLEVLGVQKTAMAVTIDAGEWNDIHPLDKKDVGERLALGACKTAYGDLATVTSGPLYLRSTIDADSVIISFNNIGSGLIAKNDTELMQFAIASSDKKYHWAQAKIIADKVIVWSNEVLHPMYVRYAWSDNPAGANLYNKEGLPASPFTTDVQ